MKIKIIAFSGSLRKDSFNTRLVHAFKDMAPDNVVFTQIDIGHLPVFNQDLEEALPPTVIQLHQTIKEADAVIFATPEYNRSYSPVLKNAIDWGSRPEGENKWARKPVAIVGATPYSLGAFGAQNHLRQVVMYLDMQPVQQPEFYLSEAKTKFDNTGTLIDEETKKKITLVWAALLELVQSKKK